MRPASGRNGPERAGRRPPSTGGASMKRCVRTLGLPVRRRRARSERPLTRRHQIPTRRVVIASLVMVGILGVHDLVHAAPPGEVHLFAFVEGQTRIRLQWSRNSGANPRVIDHKIEACQETATDDCQDADSDWTTLVADHPQEPSTTRSNAYTHTGLTAGETWHYRVWSRNSEGYVTEANRGEATATTASMPMAMDEATNNASCNGARWGDPSSEAGGAYVTIGTFGAYNHQGYRTDGDSDQFADGALDNQSFMLGDTSYKVTQLWYSHPHIMPTTELGRVYFPSSYHLAVTKYPNNPFFGSKLEDLTLYVGHMRLPLSASTRSGQSFGDSFRWSTEQITHVPQGERPTSLYDGTFNYAEGDRVMVCLTDSAPTVTLKLDPADILENGGVNGASTVTATIEQALDTAFTVTITAAAESPAVPGDFTLSENKVLSFAANATQSTGTVTITANDNNVYEPDKAVRVSAELSQGARPWPPSPVTLTIREDDASPELSPLRRPERDHRGRRRVDGNGQHRHRVPRCPDHYPHH